MTWQLETVATQLRSQLQERAPWSADGWQWGKERLQRTVRNQTRVIIRPDYDRDSYDYSPRHSKNPREVGELMDAGVIEITAYSTKVGATQADHYRQTHDLVCAVLGGLRYIDESNDLTIDYGSMGWVPPEQETEYGARYEIRFVVSENVYDETADEATGVAANVPGYMVIDGTSYTGCGS